MDCDHLSGERAKVVRVLTAPSFDGRHGDRMTSLEFNDTLLEVGDHFSQKCLLVGAPQKPRGVPQDGYFPPRRAVRFPGRFV